MNIMDAPQWLGLLKWTLANSDGTQPSDSHPINVEDKLWLEKVMKEALVDEPAKMNDTMSYLNDLLSKDCVDDMEIEEVLSIKLEELSDIVEQIDMAIVFNKFGGTSCLLRLLESPQPVFTNNVKALAAAIIGTVAQNNIKVQEDMFEKGVIQKLADLFGTINNMSVCNKILYAISCVIRNHASAEELFFKQAAAAVFGKALQSDYFPLVSRVLFLSSALITSDSASTARIAGIIDSTLPVLLNHGKDNRNQIFASLDCVEKILEFLLVMISTEHGFQTLTSDRSTADELVIALQQHFQEEGNVKDGLIKLSGLLNSQAATVLYPPVITQPNADDTGHQRGQHSSEERVSSNSNSSIPMLLMPPPPEGGVR